MADLKTVIAQLASNLAAEVVAAVRQMSLAELAGLGDKARRRGGGPRKVRARGGVEHPNKTPTGKRRRARHRRSPEQLKRVADEIVAIVKAHPKGINAEAIKTEMGIKHGNVGAKVFTRPLSVALASKRITKKGKKRATIYFAA